MELGKFLKIYLQKLFKFQHFLGFCYFHLQSFNLFFRVKCLFKFNFKLQKLFLNKLQKLIFFQVNSSQANNMHIFNEFMTNTKFELKLLAG